MTTAALFGELTADGRDIVLVAEGDDWDLAQVAARLATLTPLVTLLDDGGQPVRDRKQAWRAQAARVACTWAAVVQLGFSFNAPGFAWYPQQRLTDWIVAETVRRTGPVPPLPPGLLAPGLDRVPRSYQLDGAARIAAEGKFLLLDDPGPQPETTPVWTPAGWTELGSLQPGDLVYNRYGKPAPVQAVKYFGEQPVWRITFSDGTSTLATGSHRWRVWTKNDRNHPERRYLHEHGRVLSSDQIREAGLHYAGDHAAKFFLPQQPVIENGDNSGIELDPYAYGALLGNGSLGSESLGITGPDSEILFAVGVAAQELGTSYRWNRPENRCQNLAFHRNGKLRAVLDELGALKHSENKTVHPAYLAATAGARRALLAGLLDTDGSVTNAAVEFSSASPQLAADVAFLARSLGAVVTEADPQPAGYTRADGIKVECQDTHRLNIRFPADGPNPFLLKRKANAWAAITTKLQRRNPPRSFESIEPAGTAAVCCIELETDDPYARVYLTDTTLIPTHNTGKTTTILLGLEARRQAGVPVFPMVIVVPSWEVGTAWTEEIAAWRLPWGTPVIYKGPKRNEGRDVREFRRAGGEHGLPLITTYATLRADAATVQGPLVRLRPAAVIADEMHLVKNNNAQQSLALRRITGHAATVIGASGTPVTYDTADVHPMLEAMDPRSWPSRERMTARFCARIADDYGERVTGLNPAAETEFFAIMGRQMRRAAKADVLPELPPKVYSVRKPEIPDEWVKAYRTMEEDMLAVLPDGGELPVMSVLVQMMRLSQLASAAADVERTEEWDERLGMMVPKYAVTLKAPSWKAESLLSIIAERQHAPVVCFTASRQLAMITGRDYCEPAGLRTGYVTGTGGGVTSRTRQRAVDDFQAGKLDVIVATARAGGTGITLTRAGTAVFLQRDWALDAGIQPEDRCHRLGSAHDSIEIIDIVARGTVEDRVRQRLREKAGMLSQLVRDSRVARELLGGIR